MKYVRVILGEGGLAKLVLICSRGRGGQAKSYVLFLARGAIYDEWNVYETATLCIWFHLEETVLFIGTARSFSTRIMIYKGIQYIIIVREPKISGTTAARGLKFWLQVALSAPFATP